MCNKDHNTSKQLLTVYEERSTCIRLQVAAIITRSGRMIASGWNGVPSGGHHCKDLFAGATPEYIKEHHHAFSRENEIHAEPNALGFAARHGISVGGADMTISLSPCLECAKLIRAAGIANVFYKEEYDRDPEGIVFLQKYGIPTMKL